MSVFLATGWVLRCSSTVSAASATSATAFAASSFSTSFPNSSLMTSANVHFSQRLPLKQTLHSFSTYSTLVKATQSSPNFNTLSMSSLSPSIKTYNHPLSSTPSSLVLSSQALKCFGEQRRGFADDGEPTRLLRSKPTTPGIRHRTRINRSSLYKGGPLRSLTVGLRQSGGRNNRGRITVRHRGATAFRRLYRVIDFKRNDFEESATVQRLEYDPNRSAHIALIRYDNTGRVTYIIAPKGLKPGDQILSTTAERPAIRVGNTMPLINMPSGIYIHNVEFHPGKGAAIARSAGTAVQLMERNARPGLALIRLPSREERYVPNVCLGTIGQVSNNMHNLVSLGKAGANRWRGIRPTVRGVAMNPVDHPHGGGAGKTKGGRATSLSPTGIPAKGFRTRKRQHVTNHLITKRRQVAKAESLIG